MEVHDNFPPASWLKQPTSARMFFNYLIRHKVKPDRIVICCFLGPWLCSFKCTIFFAHSFVANMRAHARQACFLTRGDLYVSWERGRDTFDRLLIDGDPSINSANWLWLSASAFFHQARPWDMLPSHHASTDLWLEHCP